MRVLIVPVGAWDCALDARAIRRIAREEGTGGETVPILDLAALFPGGAGGGAGDPARIELEVGGRRWALRADLPSGFADIEPGRLVPIPSFVFPRGERLVRAAFPWKDSFLLLLDERELALRAGVPCS